MREEECRTDAPMRVAAELFDAITRPPGNGQASPLEPAGREHPKPIRNFLQRSFREFVMRCHKCVRPRQAGFEQPFGACFDQAAGLLSVERVEFKVMMVATVLRDLVAGVVLEVLDQVCVCGDREGGAWGWMVDGG